MPPSTNMRPGRKEPGAGQLNLWRMLRLALRANRDPLPFYRLTAGSVPSYLLSREIVLAGRRILDAGTGSGALPEALSAAGADVVAIDLEDRRAPEVAPTPFVRAEAQRLPFAKDSFDVVVSSNVLEHVVEGREMIAELIRVCRPRGVIYLSWTNWLSPFGGHEMSPLHYLGPSRALGAYRLLKGRLPPHNIPGANLFVVHVGQTLRFLRGEAVAIRDVVPRYWTRLRFIARIPGLREFAMWNCVVLFEKLGARV